MPRNKYPAHVRHAMGLAENRRKAKAPVTNGDGSVLSKHPGKGWCTIFDVGAGDGRKSIQWVKDSKKALVYAFEPDPRQFEKLKNARDRLDDKDKIRMQIFNVAVSDKRDSAANFYMCNDPSSSSLLPFVEDNIKLWKYPPGRYFFETIDVIKVPSIRLDDFLKQHQIRYIDFLYIEAQGVADKVISGLTAKRIRHVKEILWKVHITNFDIYKGQTKEDALSNYLTRNNFETTQRANYSRQQERFVRSVHIGWKKRGGKIYGLT